MAHYSYPLELDWTHEEMATVIALWNAVEKAYETGIETKQFQMAYHQFKQIVRSIAQEKQLGKAFEEVSGYSLYRVVQASKTSSKTIKMDSKRK